MKQIYILFTLGALVLTTNQLNSQTIWTGPTTTFTKANHADWNLEAGQDRITNNVWITRQNDGGLFNIVIDLNNSDAGLNTPEPSDTEWAYGTTANYTSLVFQSLNVLIGENFKDIVDGQNMVMHLITDDIYIDIKFISWTTGGNGSGPAGGGFSYERSTDQSVGINDFEVANKIRVYPNPSSDFLIISELTKTEKYCIYNMLGVKVIEGSISKDEKININNLPNGLYLLKVDGRNTVNFIKK